MNITESDIKNSIIPRLGGKRLLADQIIKRIPEHDLYIELFAGGASVLAKKEPSLYELINDIDKDLINFYRIVQTKPFEFLNELYLTLVSRELFNQYLSELKEADLTPIQRAVRYYYVIKLSFGSMGQTFGVSSTTKPRLNFLDVDHLILSAYQRLRRVTIENLPWEQCLDSYCRPAKSSKTRIFIYADPPYRCKTSHKYPAYLTDEDYRHLAAKLSGVNALWILSINDDPFIRSLFSRFNIEKIETTYSINKNTSKKVEELLISNF